MDFEEPYDADFAATTREFLNENYPARRRRPRFEWPFDPAFHKIYMAWRQENLVGRSAGEMNAFWDEVEAAGIELTIMNPTYYVARTLVAVGNTYQREILAPQFARGEALACLGYTEPDSGSDVAAAKTRAIWDGERWGINGEKIFTSFAHVATHVFLLTRTNVDVPKHNGLTMFIVPLDNPGIEIMPLNTLAYHPANITHYTDVRVPDTYRVGEVDHGWSVMRLALDFEHGAGDAGPDLFAGARPRYPAGRRIARVLNQTVEYPRQTKQPDGKPLIDDPSVRERLARIAIDNEVGRLLAGRNDPLAAQPGVGNGCKLFQTEAYVRASEECFDIAGPHSVLPYTEDDSPAGGSIEYALRDAPVLTIGGGSSEIQREIIAERRLGLPVTRARRS